MRRLLAGCLGAAAMAGALLAQGTTYRSGQIFTVGDVVSGTCTVGDLFIVRTGASAGLYFCTATNTWTQLGSGSGGGTVLLPDGTVSAPSLAFTNSTNTGLYKGPFSGIFSVAANGFWMADWNTAGLYMNNSAAVAWMSASGGTADLKIVRDAAGVVAVRDGTNAQIMQIGATTGKGSLQLGAGTFANLGTPADGILTYCSDCTIASPCAGMGTGAIAKRLNSVWVCN